MTSGNAETCREPFGQVTQVQTGEHDLRECGIPNLRLLARARARAHAIHAYAGHGTMRYQHAVVSARRYTAARLLRRIGAAGRREDDGRGNLRCGPVAGLVRDTEAPRKRPEARRGEARPGLAARQMCCGG